MSKNISEKKPWVSLGSNNSIKLSKTLSKFSIGTKGIRFKIKSKNGKRAIKKLNEILPARDVKVPRTTPITYISSKPYNEKPSKPGTAIASKKAIVFFSKGMVLIFFFKT